MCKMFRHRIHNIFPHLSIKVMFFNYLHICVCNVNVRYNIQTWQDLYGKKQNAWEKCCTCTHIDEYVGSNMFQKVIYLTYTFLFLQLTVIDVQILVAVLLVFKVSFISQLSTLWLEKLPIKNVICKMLPFVWWQNLSSLRGESSWRYFPFFSLFISAAILSKFFKDFYFIILVQIFTAVFNNQ